MVVPGSEEGRGWAKGRRGETRKRIWYETMVATMLGVGLGGGMVKMNEGSGIGE